MTLLVLRGFGEFSASPGWQVALGALVLALLPVTLLVDLVVALIHWAERLLKEPTAYARCPRGHLVELIGPWECPDCKLVHEGHAFDGCPHCGEVPEAVLCACSLPVLNDAHPRKGLLG